MKLEKVLIGIIVFACAIIIALAALPDGRTCALGLCIDKVHR